MKLVFLVILISFFSKESFSQSTAIYGGANIEKTKILNNDFSFRSFNSLGTGRQDYNAYLLSYLSSKVYAQDLLDTPNGFSSDEVWDLNQDQKKFEKLFKEKLKADFPPDTKIKWFYGKKESETLFRGVYDPEAIAISTEDYIIIVFRGTDRIDQSEGRNFVYEEWVGTNFDQFLVSGKDINEGKVHSGFYKSISVIKAEILNWVIENDGTDKSIWLAGHSLGGAHAQLFAAFLESQNNILAQGVYVYGSPKVGDQAFVDFLNKKIGKSKIQRFEFKNDPTAHAPELPIYRKAGIRNYFDDLSTYEYRASDKHWLLTPINLTGSCYHYTGWYLNATYNLLSEEEKNKAPKPLEVPTTEYAGCIHLHISTAQ